MMDKPPRRSKKFIFSAITLMALIAVAELFSMTALYLIDGKWYSPRRAMVKRESVRRQTRERSNAAALDPATQEAPTAALPGEVVHPFLGFVRDPDQVAGWKVDSLGFFDYPPPPGSEADRFTIGVFGGSLANGLVRSSRNRLVKELKTSPLLRTKQIWVRSFAMGGYKQPQQLIALNYVLALGGHFDMVLNLDGFNDIVLAPKGHPGLSPFYPIGWPSRVADLPDVEAQRLVGEIAYLEYRRMQKIDWCSGAPLSLSPSCYLAWRLSNRRAAARIRHLREALLSRPAKDRGFLTHGPEGDDATEEQLLRDLAGFWGRSSFQMHSICEGLGIHYFHFLQPNQYVPSSKNLTRREKLVAFDPRHPWGPIVPKGYPHLVETGERLVAAGVSFHDMRLVFANVETTVYSDPCCHLNQEGAGRLAAAMARIIIRELEE
ncbi:MAG: hypothetical protein GY856_38990 [bacterium]|nr:hypothetical protein [bacterium]